MRVLVISSIRCGGFYLVKQLSERYDLKLYHEPTYIEGIDFTKDIIVKLLTYTPYGYDVDKIINYSKNYDTIILLNRRDKQDHLISVWELYHNKRDMREQYTHGNGMMENKEYYSNWIDKQTICINEISKVLSIPITYYEDLYYGDVDLNGLQFTPDTSQRLRIDRPRTII